jgi:8-oxo-dGTP pyrophosphatase MutT (NUDIX family)
MPYVTELSEDQRAEYARLLQEDPSNDRALIEALAHKKYKAHIAAGGIVFPSQDELDRFWICLPSNGYGPWEFPKGHVDKGESLKQAAIREIMEEIGIHARILPGRHAYLGRPPKDQFDSFTHVFLMYQVGGIVHPSWEVEKCELVSWEEAESKFSISIQGSNKRGIQQLKIARKIVAQFYS